MTCNTQERKKTKTSAFYSRLSYSFGNEDWETENRALQLTPDARVLAITASGDRPLHLLLTNCKEVVSIDANPTQNHLLALKMAAMAHFCYEDYLSFLGADIKKKSPLRRQWFNTILPHLDAASATYWKKEIRLIEKGVLYQGVLERWLRVVAPIALFLGGAKLKRLINATTIEEQRVLVKNEWTTSTFKKSMGLILNKWVLRATVKDPGLYQFTDSNPGEYLYRRVIEEGMTKYRIKESMFLSLVLTGNVDKVAYPPYLTNDGYLQIRKRLDRINYQTIDLFEYLRSSPENSFDAFSLSDVASYITVQQFRTLLEEIIRTGKSGARICLRQFTSRYKIPADLQIYFKRDYALEKQLEKDDRCLIYSFIVGNVVK